MRLGGTTLVAALLATSDGILMQQQQLPYRRDASHWHALVMPEHKLAFCYFQKVASEHFAPLFNTVNLVEDPKDQDGSTARRQEVQWSEISKEHGWKFAFFTRDPLERYLSAFLSKCLPTGSNLHPVENGLRCYGPMRSAPVSQEEKIQMFEERTKMDAERGLPNNDHWLSQHTILTRFCDKDKFDPEKVDFIGRMTPDTQSVNDQVQAMLRGLTNLTGIAELTAAHFPVGALALVQCPTVHCTASTRVFRSFYRKQETVDIVKKLYADDYALMHIPPSEL
mmetsp:Transcript_10997/g.25852  ORF Transcript_10997/g.25852 Transcript_10997/m.25852 type:complete len:281 (+) Transcript_10997:81-923(+)|eukprot:CAMPEP_0171098078 /NCGR_PEP_ID=MMETSP0766_2-20121228/47920_1 /TAXON_ID=439317 /ORGANISM="Gambierdiscus australes, Strain CAWD 149" /LENGTH=280 /DNA_ID=CAMNT_0011557379 /DNA_START=75 /DNA_END=917 /DNA_ORIENTATION=-